MGFSAEMKDFLTGYKTVSDIVGKDEDRAIKREKIASDEAYRQDRVGESERRSKEAEAQRQGYPSVEAMEADPYRKNAPPGGGGGGGKTGGGDPDAAGSLKEDPNMYAAARSIMDIESSGGNYGALGPVTKRGDRAYGAYQVMGANVPSWTEKYTGKRMTPQEFLKDKGAQDKVFAGEFGSYLKKWGPEGAARAWFSGSPALRQGSDGYTSIPDYGKRFAAGFGKYLQAPAPTATAAAPSAAPAAAAPAAAPAAPKQAIAAAPADTSADDTTDDATPDEDEENAQAQGGVVRGFAQGGVTDPPAQAIPTADKYNAGRGYTQAVAQAPARTTPVRRVGDKPVSAIPVATQTASQNAAWRQPLATVTPATAAAGSAAWGSYDPDTFSTGVTTPGAQGQAGTPSTYEAQLGAYTGRQVAAPAFSGEVVAGGAQEALRNKRAGRYNEYVTGQNDYNAKLLDARQKDAAYAEYQRRHPATPAAAPVDTRLGWEYEGRGTMRQGGIVPSYAQGGYVDEQEPQQEQASPEEAIPSGYQPAGQLTPAEIAEAKASMKARQDEYDKIKVDGGDPNKPHEATPASEDDKKTAGKQSDEPKKQAIPASEEKKPEEPKSKQKAEVERRVGEAKKNVQRLADERAPTLPESLTPGESGATPPRTYGPQSYGGGYQSAAATKAAEEKAASARPPGEPTPEPAPTPAQGPPVPGAPDPNAETPPFRGGLADRQAIPTAPPGETPPFAGGLADRQPGAPEPTTTGGTTAPSPPLPPRRPAIPTEPTSTPTPAPRTAIPTRPQPVQGAEPRPGSEQETMHDIARGGTGSGAATQESWKKPLISYKPQHVQSMVKGGLDQIQRMTQEPGGVEKLARNEGALSQEEYNAGVQKIDPQGKLPPDEQALRLAMEQRDYYYANNMKERGDRAAAAVLLFSRKKAMQLGTMAQIALERGDVEKGLKFIQKAYEYTPDGKALTFTPPDAQGNITVSIFDRDGNKKQFTGTSDDVKAIAMQLQNGTAWMREVQGAATGRGGSQPREQRPAKEQQPTAKERDSKRTAEERAARQAEYQKRVDAEPDPGKKKVLQADMKFQDLNAAYEGKNNRRRTQVKPEEIDDVLTTIDPKADTASPALRPIKSIATGLLMGNRSMSADDAVEIARTLVAPGGPKPDFTPDGGRILLPGQSFGPFFANSGILRAAAAARKAATPAQAASPPPAGAPAAAAPPG